MKIKLPGIKEQNEIIKGQGKPLKQKKIRTSFEVAEDPLQKLEAESERLNIPPSELLRRIIEDSDVDLSPHKKRVKNATLYKGHMEKLEKMAKELVPDSRNEKSRGNKNSVVEILIKDYFKKDC